MNKEYFLNKLRSNKPSVFETNNYDLLPELNIFIEFNGYQHYSPVEFFGGEESFHLTKERDLNKKQIVKDNNGQLVIITYIHLGSNSVEKELISRLKQIYRYWFVVDGKLRVFKNALDVYKTFKLSGTTLIKDYEKELGNIIKNFHVLF